MKKKHSKQITAPKAGLAISLRISTSVPLHPDFAKNPAAFARRQDVPLVGEPVTETSFKKDPASSCESHPERKSKDKTNYRIGKPDAIKLFAEEEDGGLILKSIELDPACLTNEADLQNALRMLRAQVTPLLANPGNDSCHLVPGLADSDMSCASWSELICTWLFPHIDIRLLHDLSHPVTGRDQGRSDEQIRLKNDVGNFEINIEGCNARVEREWPDFDDVPCVRVSLRLTKAALVDALGEGCNTANIKGRNRLVRLTVADVYRVFEQTMNELEGTYLPVPAEWATMGKPVTGAKAIALMSVLTPIPVDELLAMYKRQHHPSKSTFWRLEKDLTQALACLKPAPVSGLFLTRLPNNQP